MLGFGLGLNKARRVGGYTPSAEVAAYLAKLTTEGFALPSVANQQLLDTFVAALKSAGAWASLDVIQMWAQDSNSVNAGRVNLKSPSDTMATLYNAVTFTNKVGIAGDGVSAYVDTGYNPSSYGGNHTLNDAGFLAYMTSASGEGALVGGTFADTSMRRRSLTIHRLNAGANSLNSAFDFTTSAGVKAFYRLDSTNVNLYNNKTVGNRTQTSFQVRNMNIWLLRDFGTYGAHGIGLFIAGSSLDSQHSAVVDAIENYITGVAAL